MFSRVFVAIVGCQKMSSRAVVLGSFRCLLLQVISGICCHCFPIEVCKQFPERFSRVCTLRYFEISRFRTLVCEVASKAITGLTGLRSV